MRIRIGTTVQASARLTHVVTKSTRRAQVVVHPELHAGDHRGAGEQRADQRREDALEDERRLDESIGCPDQPHDADLTPSRIGGEPDRRRDQQHRRDEHQRRDSDGDVGRHGQRGEQRLEILELILDLLDALHAV